MAKKQKAAKKSSSRNDSSDEEQFTKKVSQINSDESEGEVVKKGTSKAKTKAKKKIIDQSDSEVSDSETPKKSAKKAAKKTSFFDDISSSSSEDVPQTKAKSKQKSKSKSKSKTQASDTEESVSEEELPKGSKKSKTKSQKKSAKKIPLSDDESEESEEDVKPKAKSKAKPSKKAAKVVSESEEEESLESEEEFSSKSKSKAKPSKKPAKKVIASDSEKEEEESEEEAKPKAKSKAKPSKKAAKKSIQSESEEEVSPSEEEEVKSKVKSKAKAKAKPSKKVAQVIPSDSEEEPSDDEEAPVKGKSKAKPSKKAAKSVAVSDSEEASGSDSDYKPKPKASKKASKKVVEPESEGESSEEEAASPKAKSKAKSKAKKPAKKTAQILPQSDEELSQESEDEVKVPSAKTKAKAKPSKKAAKKVAQSESEEEASQDSESEVKSKSKAKPSKKTAKKAADEDSDQDVKPKVKPAKKAAKKTTHDSDEETSEKVIPPAAPAPAKQTAKSKAKAKAKKGPLKAVGDYEDDEVEIIQRDLPPASTQETQEKTTSQEVPNAKSKQKDTPVPAPAPAPAPTTGGAEEPDDDDEEAPKTKQKAAAKKKAKEKKKDKGPSGKMKEQLAKLLAEKKAEEERIAKEAEERRIREAEELRIAEEEAAKEAAIEAQKRAIKKHNKKIQKALREKEEKELKRIERIQMLQEQGFKIPAETDKKKVNKKKSGKEKPKTTAEPPSNSTDNKHKDQSPIVKSQTHPNPSSQTTKTENPHPDLDEPASWETILDQQILPSTTVSSTSSNVSSAKAPKEKAQSSAPAPAPVPAPAPAPAPSASSAGTQSASGAGSLQAFPAKGKAAKKVKAEEVVEEDPSNPTLRSPICCILGHVDAGKTKVLDSIRRSNVQEGEAGGITQQIGATYFPLTTIQEITKALNEKHKLTYKIPGLLIIDTPGHESFSNLRSRGSSLCDISILVVDLFHGLQPQTLESLNLLKKKQTPFIVALNKVDRIYGWKENRSSPIQATLAKQDESAKSEYEMRVNKMVVQFAEQGLNAVAYYKNKDFRKYVSMVPTSATTGEGIPDLLMLLVQLTQSLMVKRLTLSPQLTCTVLEVKMAEGLGSTVDVVLSNGSLHEGDTIVVAGINGPIVTTIRALLTPQPCKEMRVTKSGYIHNKVVHAAAGIKIAGPDLDKAVAGSSLFVVGPDDDVEDLKTEVMADFKSLFQNLDKSGTGVCVQASTLGALEALLVFLKESKIPISNISLGPVHKKDVRRATIMLEHDKLYAVILAFDVKIEKEAAELAEEEGVKIFSADVIYHLFDKFTKYMEEHRAQKQKEAAEEAVFPCVLRILPECIFNKKDPIVIGVEVIDGVLKLGTPLSVVRSVSRQFF
eukprot:TRINITY_DN3055_c0_g2_i2.p1 TRINITY_DN3055_c0_g2~~TRINITY_DN3055_c0_g2_i2.p1  ORF type:complete len:1380 (+),score=477.99 TRINITY_DN3055_c0_g2_i2:32-4141(+)